MLKDWKDVKELKNVYLAQICPKNLNSNNFINCYYLIGKTFKEANNKYKVFEDKYTLVRIIKR